MRVLVTGASGVLGRAAVPLLLRDRGHDVLTPRRAELDLFDAGQVHEAVRGVDAVLHLATRIPPPERRSRPDAWDENDRLRAVATRNLVDGALASDVAVVVVPTVAFIPAGDVPAHLRSALEAEAQVARFTAAGRRGVVLRLGSLYGPGAEFTQPSDRYDVHVHTGAAGAALAAAIFLPAGVHDVADERRTSVTPGQDLA